MALEKFANDIMVAKELLEKAKADYRAEALKLLDEGKLSETKESVWKERYGHNGLTVYCDRCRAIANNGVKFFYCPSCGSKMSNASTLIHYISEESKPKNDDIPEIPEIDETNDKTSMGKKRLSMSQQAIKDLKSNKLSVTDIKTVLGLSSGQYYMITKGEGVPKTKTFNRIKDQYKSYFGSELEEPKY